MKENIIIIIILRTSNYIYKVILQSFFFLLVEKKIFKLSKVCINSSRKHHKASGAIIERFKIEKLSSRFKFQTN